MGMILYQLNRILDSVAVHKYIAAKFPEKANGVKDALTQLYDKLAAESFKDEKFVSYRG